VRLSNNSSGLELAEEPLLLLGCLETPVPKLGRGVDELELDLLERQPGGLLQQGLAEGDDPLLGANAAALDHEVVSLHHTVMREATHRGDVLLSPASASQEDYTVLVYCIDKRDPVY
jgi:hypothetical protein